MSIGKNIQTIRKKRGLSQQALGEMLGVSGSMIGQYENNLRNPKPETLEKLASALKVSSIEFFQETLSGKLYSVIKETGATPEQLAVDTGIPYKKLVDIAKEKRVEITKDEIATIERVLGVEIGDLNKELLLWDECTNERPLGKRMEKNLSYMENALALGANLELSENGETLLSEEQKHEMSILFSKWNLLVDQLNTLPVDERQKVLDAVLTLIDLKKGISSENREP